MNCVSSLRVIVCTLIVLSSGFVSSCSQTDGGKSTTSGNEVRVMADYCLKPTLSEIIINYQQETANKVHVKYAVYFDIHPDTPTDSVDVYLLSNNQIPSSDIDSTAKLTGRISVLAYTIPCIIVPQLNPALIANLSDLARSGTRVGIADPTHDILGAFTVEILKDNHLYDQIKDRLIIVETSAQDLAERVARKSLDAAIGWNVFPNWTQGGTDVVLLSASEIPRIAAVTAWRSSVPVDSISADKLMTYLKSDRCLEVFRKWGYITSPAELVTYAPIGVIGGLPSE